MTTLTAPLPTWRRRLLTLLAASAALVAASQARPAADAPRLALTLLDGARLEIRDARGQRLASVPTGEGPRQIGRHGGKLFVVNRGVGETPGSTVTIVDERSATGATTHEICDGCAPRAIAFDADGKLWFSAQAHRAVYWAEPPYEDPSGSVLVEWGWPAVLAADDDGQTLVVGFRNGENVAIIDMPAMRMMAVRAGTLPAFVIARPGSSEWIIGSDRGGAVTRLMRSTTGSREFRTETVVESVALGGLASSPDGRSVYLADAADRSVRIIDLIDGSERARYEAGEPTAALAVSPDGRRVAVSLPQSRSVLLLEVDDRGSLAAAGRFEVDGLVGDLLWIP